MALFAVLVALATGAPAQTSAGYTHAVTHICAGALLFAGTHEIGTRAGAIAVSKDIRATGGRRLRRVDAVPKPPATAQLAVQWIALERRLVEVYAATYLQIWNAIERADTPREHARLPGILHRLVHRPDALQRRAAALELVLDVPECTGGGSHATQPPP